MTTRGGVGHLEGTLARMRWFGSTRLRGVEGRVKGYGDSVNKEIASIGVGG